MISVSVGCAITRSRNSSPSVWISWLATFCPGYPTTRLSAVVYRSPRSPVMDSWVRRMSATVKGTTNARDYADGLFGATQYTQLTNVYFVDQRLWMASGFFEDDWKSGRLRIPGVRDVRLGWRPLVDGPQPYQFRAAIRCLLCRQRQNRPPRRIRCLLLRLRTIRQ